MESQGQLIIHIVGKYGAEKLTPKNYDVTLMQSVLEYVSALLGLDKKKGRPAVTYQTMEGSVNNVFTMSKQKAVEIAAVMSLFVNSGYSLDALETTTATALENLQKFAIQNDFSLDISSSEPESETITITPKTIFKRSENLWVDAEVYYYGTLVDAGGKNKSNIHLDTKDGLIKIDADKELLTGIEGNPLYRKFGVRAIAKQNVVTGAIDSSTLKMKELFEFEPRFDADYLESKIEAATSVWSGVDADEFVHQVREGWYDGE